MQHLYPCTGDRGGAGGHVFSTRHQPHVPLCCVYCWSVMCTSAPWPAALPRFHTHPETHPLHAPTTTHLQ